MPAVIEVRTYRTVPGARAVLIEALRTRSFPAHRDLGMKVLGPFPVADGDDAFVWLRAYPDAASREPMRNAFYEGDLWLRELEPQLMPLISGYEATLVEDAIGLWHRWPQAG